MRWLVMRSRAIVLLLILPLLAVRWLGSFRENPAALIFGINAEQIAQPCFRHICPGRTSFTEVETWLRGATNRVSDIYGQKNPGSSRFLCWREKLPITVQICIYQPEDIDIINRITISPDFDDFPVSLGDVVALLGTPTASNLCISQWTVEQNRWVAGVQTAFKDGKIIVESYTPQDLLAWRVDPAQSVAYIQLSHRPMPLGAGVTWKWRGFITGPGEPFYWNG